MPDVITNNLDLWSSALRTKSTAGRGSNVRVEAYGIKKLRELILELAVRGKLVLQDPADEPASVLLGRIAKEKARLAQQGILTKQVPLPEIADTEEYFSLPNGWVWSRLGEVSNYGITDKAEPRDADENTWVLDLEDVEKESSRLLQKVRYAEKPFQSSKNRFSKGDVIYGKLRPYLDKVIVADEDGVCTTEMIPVRGYVDIFPFYLRLVMKTPHFISYADESTHGMNLPRLGTEKARMAPFPIAPLSEQHRIVAKVDELMALCDQLEQRQNNNIEAHQILVEALLGTLTNVELQEEFTEAWNRIANHFDTLFITEQSIDQFKQTILQLAVMGKLVSQELNDEPARVLLEKIAKEKKKLVKEGEIKKQKELAEIVEDVKPFAIPISWEFSYLQDLCELITDGTHQTPAYTVEGRPFISAQCVKPFKFLPDNCRYVSENDYQDYIKSRKPEYRDILLARVGAGIGEAALIDTDLEFAIYVSTGLLKPFKDFILSEYLVLWLNSPDGRNNSEKSTYGKGVSQGNLNLSLIRSFVVSVPPLAEQRRIVAKVNELMTLCDTLKARLAAAQTTQIHLADTIVEQAVA